ncbi:MAG: HAD family hydrolase [Deltaproteobacteria bacterium]|nr:HAD family hydrolase [Deltaproteobacteria bacterium]
MNTIIFDIDGTLVQSKDFDTELYIRAVTELLGNVQIHNDWALYTHVTDSGILSQILEENKIVIDEALVGTIKSRFGELIESHLRYNPCLPVDGAIQVLDEIRSLPDWRLGLATGGWRHTASAKLRSAGFDLDDIVMCTSDEHHARTEIMKLCLKQIGGKEDKVVYVGDGQWDLNASRELGWGFVAIGPELQSDHGIWISNFLDPAWKASLNKALVAPRKLFNP